MSELLFYARKILTALILPPTGPLLVAILGLLLLRSRPRAGRALAWLGVLTLLVLSFPFVAHSLVRAAAFTAPVDLAQAADAQAIVILGGGLRRNAREYGGDTLNTLSLERVRYGARLAKDLKLPVLVSGGVVWGDTAESDVMAETLERELGVPVRWRERESRDTRTNAIFSAKILKAEGIRRVLLVVHSFDVPRAAGEFALNGIEAIPAPTVLPSERLDSPMDAVPSMSALVQSYWATYELVADAVRRLRVALGRGSDVPDSAAPRPQPAS
jgi:uncharacterized SAM-binding protein YcdF (DUF218 family)